MKNKLLIVAMVVISTVAFTGCEAQRRSVFKNLNAITIKRKPALAFQDLTKGLEVYVLPTQPKEEISGTMLHVSGKPFFKAPTVSYVRSMGLTEMYAHSDYRLYLTIDRADVDYKGTYSDVAYVEISVVLKDAKGNEVFAQKNITTTANGMVTIQYNKSVSKGLDEAYTQALEQINWNRIASFLRVEDLPKEEPQKSVQGYGDTALEQTIIRWDVQSRPQGADIFWRVASKTPEVKSTNNKYLMTTPYEATKALDIRGLTYQTASNVRIILRCEKDGYMPQEKEYDVRMVLDQEEISAFFRLVKEEE